MNDVETKGGVGAAGVIAGFLGGALVGAVLTLLLAPRSGPDTRRKIVERAERSRDALERVGTAAKEATSAARAAFTAALHEEAVPR